MALSLQPAGNKSPFRELIPTRVLVVDDEPLVRWSVCTSLAIGGFDAVAAATADDACALAAEWPPPKVVVLDVQRERDGADLMHRLRTIYPDCRFVIMTTAKPEPGGADQRGVRTIQKPFDLRELRRLIGQVIGGSSLL